MPLYNEVVWVKLGHYRWWPARVIHPAEVPVNVERSPHAMGEFPIKVFEFLARNSNFKNRLTLSILI